MAALVQSYPQSTGTVTLLHTRPTSASGMLPTQSQQAQQYGHGASQQRNGLHGMQGAVGRPIVYRGSAAPVQPYAFTSTPSLNRDLQWQQSRTSRTTSMPAVPTVQTFDQNQNAGRPRYLPSASMTNLPSGSTLGYSPATSLDDSSIAARGIRRVATSSRPQSAYLTATPPPATLAQPQTSPVRISPERYRRPTSRNVDSSSASGPQVHPQPSAPPSGLGMANVNHLYGQRTLAEQKATVVRNQQTTQAARPTSFVGSAADDMQLNRTASHEEARRFRRRSLPSLDSAGFPKLLTPPDHAKQSDESSQQDEVAPLDSAEKQQQKSARLAATIMAAENSKASHVRRGSSESLVSSLSGSSRPSSSANRNTNVSAPTGNPALLSSQATDHNQDYRLVNIPPRSSSSDAATTSRVANPSPLSQPVAMDSETEKRPPSAGTAGANASPTLPASPTNQIESAAVKHLAAISERSGRLKSKTSRLRRAFSFSSAAEFRKAAGPEMDAADSPHDLGPAKLHKDPSPEELYDAEQARIAQKQEEAGLGNSIYSGGRFFSGSTDNISVSSTASSASIMIRKMGRGMKKGGRSLVGLFRPKSVISIPDADAQLPEASQATVSMVTVEAERQRVNINVDPHDQNGGGTGFPRLERNSIDASKPPRSSSDRVGSSGTDNSASRRSIVGGEKERAEVLAAVRKGILKHTNRSPSPKPSEERGTVLDLPNAPQSTDSPSSTAPSTPNDEAHGHRRTGSIAIGNEDYFVSALRLRQDTKSAPGTPQGSAKRNATFSPRIIFHDTWPSGEYDRRGEIATCNRLTPMLAQQIKEELNNFKMEMEVHENSKIYTHFF
ncbi:hypothetical protein QBC33DRAFT_384784 [Phialemonium atrogriseum]|uniref:Protein BNI4 n=1 Tax=Phialemonium atrogriseum TaxID=1093897 RepID=A0AAJ0C337_9PEZI|nr:uncharacterized protein QBC33DRAFT_384784 [Phialemonium atrogriseum]KAK1768617.1 hypothetical protein QBC33DRAFT_384784 [Phialemonium atrogriseum]